MENKIKCFSEEHKGVDAISFCQECRIYICYKYENIHSSFFKNHNAINLNKLDEIFTGFCPEKNHQIKLKYFCRNHNKLCCGLCIAKLNKEGDGQHKDCEVCYIENIINEKRNLLKENIKYLEEIENKFNENMKELKGIFSQIEKDKDELKQKVQKIFTKIRNTLNDREDKLLLDIDNLYNSIYLDEDIIRKGEKLPKQIKLSIEKGKIIGEKWENNNDINLYSYINDCINIENNIKYIKIINGNVNELKKKNNIAIKFAPKEDLLDDFLNTLNSFGKIFTQSKNYKFRECPLNIDKCRTYTLSGENNNILTKTGDNNGYMGTLCEDELDKKIEEHRWKIKILKSFQNSIMVGVAPGDFDICSSNYKTCGWYLFCYSSPPKLFSGPPYNYYNYKTDLRNVTNEVVVVMNMKKRTLKFIINSEDKGDSYHNIPIDKPLFPAVLLLNTGDSVEISEC